jgi:hypothetical protein
MHHDADDAMRQGQAALFRRYSIAWTGTVVGRAVLIAPGGYRREALAAWIDGDGGRGGGRVQQQQ